MAIDIIPGKNTGSKTRLLVKNGQSTLEVKDIDLGNPDERADFVEGLASRFPGVRSVREDFEQQLLEIAANVSVEGERMSQASTLAMLVEQEDVELFHTPGGLDSEAYATVNVNGHLETWSIRSKGFRTWLSRVFHLKHDKVPGSQAVQDALGVITGKALYDGPEIPVSLRLAKLDDCIWLDLCDSEWRAVRVDANGWEVTDGRHVPVRFVRRRGMLPLCVPVRGGSLSELRSFVNLPDEDQWRLAVAWLVMALNPTGPYPVLNVCGEQGSAKTTLFRLLRALVDPNKAPLRRPPKSERDLMIAANNGWILGFDNLSSIPDWLSDALCTLATGGGFGARELYSDDEEKLFSAMRPSMINGIDDLATRSDLLDRSVSLMLPTIPDEKRRDEKELQAAFDEAHPRILGALLDAISTAIRNRPRVKLNELPRMADFALWIAAAEPALGWQPGGFIRAYQNNRESANTLAIESSPVGPTIIAMMEGRHSWEGTAGSLLDELDKHQSDESVRQRKDWPKTPPAMGNAVRRVASNLRRAGINHVPPHAGDKKRIHRLERDGSSSPKTPLSPPCDADTGSKSDMGDLGGLMHHGSEREINNQSVVDAESFGSESPDARDGGEDHDCEGPAIEQGDGGSSWYEH